MNTGIQDAGNLAWKLTAVLRGQAGESLLDTYAAERIPIANWVLSTSDGLFGAVTKVHSPVFGFLRTLFFKTVFCCVPPAAFPPEFVKGKMFGMTHNYQAEGTCQDIGSAAPSKAIKAGDRLPDLPCFDQEGTLAYMLKLLADAPGFGQYHAYFVEGRPRSDDERSGAVQTLMNVIAQRVPVLPFLYLHKSNSVPPSVQQRQVRVTFLAPQVAPLLPTLQDELRLRSSEVALVIARPDGYVSIVQRGATWDAAGTGAALVKLAGTAM